MSDTTPETAVEKLAAEIQRTRMVPYEDGKGGWLFRAATPTESAAAILASGVVVPAGETGALTEDERASLWGHACQRDYVAAVERIVAARTPARDDLADKVRALHHRRPHSANGGQPTYHAFDFVAHGQTEFPDLCDHCRSTWPCPTAALLDDAEGERDV